MKILLTPFEMEVVALAAAKHVTNALERGSKSYARQEREWLMANAFNGYSAELAFAKATKRYWSMGIGGGVGKPDFLPDIDVKYGNPRLNALTLVPGKVKPDWRYVLVVGVAPELEVAGWIWGRDGEKPEFLQDPTGTKRPAYFIPRDRLTPIKA